MSAAPGWQRRAACRTEDPESFFPEWDGAARAAQAVCAGCPVRAECLDYAIKRGITHGIWGGLTEQERRPLANPDALPMCRNDLHVMTEKNTYTYPNGVKSCRACREAGNQRREPRRHDGKPCRTERAA
jgi:hypothetical protein